MSYQITVKKIESVTKEEPGPYAIVGEEFISTEEFLKLPYNEKQKWETNPVREGFARPEGSEYRRNLYGNTDKRPVTKEVTTTIYEQTVDELDMANLVKAINRLQ